MDYLRKIVLFALFFSLFNVIWGDENGVWTNAGDIRGGIFGSDEGSPSYIFPSNLSVNHSLSAESFCIDGDCRIDWSTIWKISGNNIYYDAGNAIINRSLGIPSFK